MPLTGRGTTHAQRKGIVSGKERNQFSFLLLLEGPTSPFSCGTLVNLSTSTSRLFYQQTATKKHQIMGSSKTPTKTLYNGLSKLQLKHRIIDFINPEK